MGGQLYTEYTQRKTVMKLLQASLPALLAASANALVERISEKGYPGQHVQFRSWAEKHGREYDSKVKHDEAFYNFLQNAKFIADHNARYRNGDETYFVTLNRFADMTKEEITATFLDHREDAPILGGEKGDAQMCIEHYNDRVYPSTCPGCFDAGLDHITFNWGNPQFNPYGRTLVTSVKDQGSCGSCWAFAAAATLEGYVCKLGLQDCTTWSGISPQNIVDCNLCDDNGQNPITGNICSYGCSGGWSQTGWEYVMVNDGIDDWDSYKYTSGNTGKETTCAYQEANNVLARGGRVYGCAHSKHLDEVELMDALYTQGPVKVSIDASSSGFHFYAGGVLTDNDCANDHTNHAVTATGYGIQQGMDYYVIKNSWGKGWGMDGYVYFRRNYDNMCAVARKPYYPLFGY